MEMIKLTVQDAQEISQHIPLNTELHQKWMEYLDYLHAQHCCWCPRTDNLTECSVRPGHTYLLCPACLAGEREI